LRAYDAKRKGLMEKRTTRLFHTPLQRRMGNHHRRRAASA
jgi:hypothetical protein